MGGYIIEGGRKFATADDYIEFLEDSIEEGSSLLIRAEAERDRYRAALEELIVAGRPFIAPVRPNPNDEGTRNYNRLMSAMAAAREAIASASSRNDRTTEAP